MIRHITILLIVGACLAALIFYSQLRSEPQRVSGIIETDEIRLGSRIGGRVAKVNVEEGEQVNQGQLLIELEPFDLLEKENEAIRKLAAREADYRRLENGLRPEEVAQAEAHHDQLKAHLDLLEAGPRDQEIDASRARLQVAQAGLRLAQQLHERHSELVKENAVSVEQLERTNEKLEAAQAMLVVRQKELQILELGARDEEEREARAAVEEAKQAWQMAASGYRQEEIDEAKAARDAARAALDAIRRAKEELLIKSPISGRVEALDLQPGDMVPPGAPVLSIIDDRHLWVRAYVPQSRVGMPIGRQLRVTVDSLPQQSFMGTVSFISRQAEFTPSNVQTPEERSKQVFRVKVVLRDADRHLRPGMTVDLWLDPVGEVP
jgi:multidrug resistance efflux pump